MKRESLLTQKKAYRPTEFVKRLTNDSSTTEQAPSAIKFRRSYGANNTNNSTIVNGEASKQFSASVGNLNASFQSNGGTPTRYIGNLTFPSANGVDMMPGPSRDEFYNYLRIDTNPPVEKSPEVQQTTPDPANNQRRSLRVFMQQRQMESVTRSQETIGKSDDEEEEDGKRPAKSPCKSVRNLPIRQPQLKESKTAALALRRRSEGFILSQRPKESDDLLNGTEKTPTTHILAKRSYHRSTYTLMGDEPSQDVSESDPLPSNQNDNVQTMEIEANATAEQCSTPIETDASASNTITNKSIATNTVSKRRMLIKSPLMISEIVRRYRNCVRRGVPVKQFANPRIFRRIPRRTFARPEYHEGAAIVQPNVDVGNNDLNGANEMSMAVVQPVTSRSIDTQTDVPMQPPIIPFSATSITHSTASSDSAVVLNRAAPELVPEPVLPPTLPRVTMTASQSLQWYQEHSIGVDRSKCLNPLQVKHGPVKAILTQSIADNQNECIVVVQESMVSYWFSPAKMVGIFGVARTWLPIGQHERCLGNGELWAFLFSFLVIFDGRCFV